MPYNKESQAAGTLQQKAPVEFMGVKTEVPIFGVAGQLLGNYLQNRAYEKWAKAYGNSINEENSKMDAYRKAYENTLKGYQQSGEDQFMDEANTPLPELNQMRQDITDQNTEAQHELAGQMNANLAKTGVRGGQAGTIMGRAMGKQDTDMQRQINEMAVNEATNRQKAKLDYTAQKGMYPYKTLTTNDNLYLPDGSEKYMRYNAINKQYGAA